MENFDQQLQQTKTQLLKAIGHLDYSYKKVLTLSEEVDQLDEEGLEVWESFAARFSRVSDIFIVKYLRTVVMINDPGFRGSVRDFINQGEKLGLIDDANVWMRIRGLHNISAHEYAEEDLAPFLRELREHCSRLLSLKEIINQ